MAGIGTTVYNVLFKRSSTFIVTIIACSFFFERTVDLGAKELFEWHNKGKLFKHIKDNYSQE